MALLTPFVAVFSCEFSAFPERNTKKMRAYNENLIGDGYHGFRCDDNTLFCLVMKRARVQL